MKEKDQIVEMNEAVIAGKQALASLKKAEESLKHASNWGIADMLGGGFITDMLKHSKLREAENHLEEARIRIRTFQKELRDLEMPHEFYVNVDGFLTFADFFFDGLIVDWLVQSRIREAREEVEQAIIYVETVVAELQRWEKQYLQKDSAVQ
jgi:hypothetical protein